MINSRRLFLIWILILVTFACCKSKVERTLEGLWSIDTIIYKQYEIRNCILGNVIKFEHPSCDLPTTESYCEGLVEYIREGQWEVEKTDSIPLVLKIETKNMIFSGVHKMTFRKDEQNKLLKMELRSDSLYVICRKGLFNYDGNQDLVNDLIKISH